MARANTRTLLSLDEWARIMGFHPLHFNGIAVSGLAPSNICGSPIMQYAWQQSDGVAREDIATAIADAEARIAQYVGFKLLPTFEVDERHAWPRLAQPDLFVGAGMLDARGMSATVKTDWAHVVAGGVEGLTTIAAAAPIVYADLDGDGYKETATVTVATTVSDANEIAVFYPGMSGDHAWEIRPLKVVFVGGNAAITLRREQLLNPGLLEGFGGRATDGLDDTMFLQTVDVYRSWHDPSQQVQFLWENSTFGNCGCGVSTCTTCYLLAQFGCSIVRDYRLGLMTGSPATWNSITQNYEATTLSVARAPDRVRLWYRAGYRDQTLKRPSVEMSPAWARAVAYFATALLARPMCSCQNVTAAVEMWQEDLAKIRVGQSSSENFNVDRNVLNNPFGTSRGAIYAWNVFRNLQIGEAVTV